MNVLLNMYICALRKNSVPLSLFEGTIKMYTHGTILNSNRTSTKINKNGAIAEVRICRTSDIIKHLKTFL